MGGFFKVYRSIFQHEIFKNELDFRLFMLILGNAVFAEEGVTQKNVHIKRGQWVRSYRRLMEDLEYKEKRGYKKYGIATIKRAIDRLIKNGLVAVRETENGTLFTVVNYEEYQGISGLSEEVNGTLIGTKSERHRNNNKNVKNEKKKDSPARTAYDDDSPYMKMTNYFLEKIREWKPDYIFRGKKQTWADHFRLLHEKDKRSKKDIQNVIDWTTSNPFWQPNVLSPEKLRKQFDTLQAQMDNQSKKVVSFEDKRERARQENADRKILTNQWLSATGKDPSEYYNELTEWIEVYGGNKNELTRYTN